MSEPVQAASEFDVSEVGPRPLYLGRVYEVRVGPAEFVAKLLTFATDRGQPDRYIWANGVVITGEDFDAVRRG